VPVSASPGTVVDVNGTPTTQPSTQPSAGPGPLVNIRFTSDGTFYATATSGTATGNALVIVRDHAITISNDIWWFGGGTVPGYSNTAMVTLTGAIPPHSTVTWSITGNTAAAAFLDANGKICPTVTTPGNVATIISTGPSTSVNDFSVSAIVNPPPCVHPATQPASTQPAHTIQPEVPRSQ
jgi:hypothetical protein